MLALRPLSHLPTIHLTHTLWCFLSFTTHSTWLHRILRFIIGYNWIFWLLIWLMMEHRGGLSLSWLISLTLLSAVLSGLALANDMMMHWLWHTRVRWLLSVVRIDFRLWAHRWATIRSLAWWHQWLLLVVNLLRIEGSLGLCMDLVVWWSFSRVCLFWTWHAGLESCVTYRLCEEWSLCKVINQCRWVLWKGLIRARLSGWIRSHVLSSSWLVCMCSCHWSCTMDDSALACVHSSTAACRRCGLSQGLRCWSLLQELLNDVVRILLLTVWSRVDCALVGARCARGGCVLVLHQWIVNELCVLGLAVASASL